MRSAVDRCCAKAIITRLLATWLTHLTKYDALSNGQEVVERDQDLIFVVLVSAIHVELPDVVHRKLILLQLNLVRVRCELVGEISHIVRERGGEKQDLHRAIAGEHAIHHDTVTIVSVISHTQVRA